MRIGIVEDNAEDGAALAALVSARLAGEGCEGGAAGAEGGRVDVFSTAQAFRDAYRPGLFDIVLLDCYLDGEETGMGIARALRAAGDDAAVLFTTSSPDFAVEGYEVGAVGYLMKPVDAAKLDAALARLPKRAAGAGAQAARRAAGIPVAIPASGNRDCPASIDASALTYCMADGHYLNLHFDAHATSRETLRARMRFRDLEEALSAHRRFYQCARGCLVNLEYVVSVGDGDFVLASGAHVPITQRNLNAARKRWAEHMFARMREEPLP